VAKILTNRTYVKVALIAAFLVVAGKLSAFGLNVAMAYFFGAGLESDAYFIANTIPGLLWGVFFASINVAFLPIYTRAKLEKNGSDQFLVHEAVQIYGLLAIVLTLVGVLTAPQLVRLASPNVSAPTAQLATSLTIIMAFGFAFSGYVAIQNVIQQTNGRFLAPLTVPFANNMLAIAGIVVAALMSDIRIAAYAAVAAWLLQAALQRVQTLGDYRPNFSIAIRRATVRNLALLSTPIMLATLLDQVNLFLGTYLAGDLGEGVISQLNYASRLALLVSGTISTLISYFLFPRIANAAAGNDSVGLSRVVTLGLITIVATTLPLALISILMRREIIAIIYGYGQTSAADILATAAIYAAFAVGILFMAVREFINRIFFSYQKNSAPLLIGIVACGANIAVSIQLTQSLGAVGIALGASFGAAVYFVGQLGLLMIWRPGLLDRALASAMGQLAMAAFPAWLAALWFSDILIGVSLWVRLISVSAVFVVIFASLGLAVSKRLRAQTRAITKRL
jgi:putative peptidoglycan lipid II flippase